MNRITQCQKTEDWPPRTMEQVADGKFVPIIDDRKRFAKEMYDIITDKVLDNATGFRVVLGDAKIAEFELPPKENLLDFLSLEQTGNSQDIAVTIQYPDRSTEESADARYWVQKIVYSFPKPYQLIRKKSD